jgi:hypothetical protein
MKLTRLPAPVIKILAWALSTRFWNEIVRTNLRLRGYPKLAMDSYFKMREIIRQNPDALYMFVGADDANVALKIQRWAINIRWAHSGFVELGEDGELWASHVRHTGYRRCHLIRYLKEVDHFAVIRLSFPDKSSEDEARARLKKIQDSEVRYNLDYCMNKRPQYGCDPLKWEKPFYLYCSEYQYIVCRDLTNNWKSGRSELTPDDVYRGGEVVFEE